MICSMLEIYYRMKIWFLTGLNWYYTTALTMAMRLKMWHPLTWSKFVEQLFMIEKNQSTDIIAMMIVFAH